MADTQNHTQVVTNILNSIRVCVNALALSDHANSKSITDLTSSTEVGEVLEHRPQVEYAILLLLEENCYSAHKVRVDDLNREYKLSSVTAAVNDLPNNPGGGVLLDTIPYCFARPKKGKKWKIVHVHEGDDKLWTEDHIMLKDFWCVINNQQIALEDKKPLVQSILATLYTQDCLDNLDVKEFIISMPDNMGIGLFDTLKTQCATEGLTRQIEHREHVFALLTEYCRYVRTPTNPSILYSLLRSVEGVPSEEQAFLFFNSDNQCTFGHLKQGAFEEQIVSPNMLTTDVDMKKVYAVGVVDEGKIVNPLLENGYYNFCSMDDARYMAKTLAIVQEGALECFKIAELIANLKELQDVRDKLQAESAYQGDQVTRLKHLLSIPAQESFLMQLQNQVR